MFMCDTYIYIYTTSDIYLWEPQPLYVFLDLSHDPTSGSERLTAETGATGMWCSLPL